MIFRKALPDDAERVSALVNSAYRGESSKAGWTTEADLVDGERTNPDLIQEIISTKHNQIFVVEKDNLIIGSLHLIQEDLETLYAGMLAVEPTLQAGGVGKFMLNKVFELGAEVKVKKIRITVISVRPELIKYYERLGFELTGKEEPFPHPELAKVEDLHFLEMIKRL